MNRKCDESRRACIALQMYTGCVQLESSGGLVPCRWRHDGVYDADRPSLRGCDGDA